ncbi:hypothetical protein ANOM_001614 [Aspergillus nomiae NRRL 13137]|uniref:GPR1/FUN34/YaaH-class plasma membrane protein n=1 Tax=Aspergillus nomiae NRRL (strain ATCC 15546 / NRRL 13137 / CBS 260.88 / M93) TaxID=1509407 RepID=A0A0L1JC11_ASPN3|nr:uncharacterized protein ANOM_001614 [Aspergillus nomiae NRRL 13137]KNG89265.1 hypothetical protein ANOM_001614 [Aspergillus nomiae NRRL 13137]
MDSDKISEPSGEATSTVLRHIETTNSVFLPISRAEFEKLYLNPKTSHKGQLHKTFGNPTPIALMGFLIAALPMSCIQMGWRGAGGNGGAILPVYIIFGGFLQYLGAIGEWIIGNTYPCALFFTYGSFWLVNGASLMPFFGVGTNYSPTGNSLEGQTTPMFYSTVAFFYVFLGVLTFIYTICALRTNLCLLVGLFMLVIDVGFFCGVYFHLALGHDALAAKLQIAAGALTFVLCIPVSYLFVTQILDAVDFPIALPVGELGTAILGKSERAQRQARKVQQDLPYDLTAQETPV